MCGCQNGPHPVRQDPEAEITALRARLEAVERERDAAIAAMSEQARKRGEAEGRLQASELAGIVEGWKSRAERAEAALHGPIKPITQDDMANIIAHLSPDLEPAGPLPNRNSVMMALIKVKNAHKAALATARRDALEEAAKICDCRDREKDDSMYLVGCIDASQANAKRIRALAQEQEPTDVSIVSGDKTST